MTDDRTTDGPDGAGGSQGGTGPGTGGMADLDSVLDRRLNETGPIPPPPADGAAVSDDTATAEAGSEGPAAEEPPPPPPPLADTSEDPVPGAPVMPGAEEPPAAPALAGDLEETAAMPAASPLAGFDEGERPRRGRKVALVAVLVLVLLGGLYVGAAWFLGDRVPADATVAGVPIGGMTREEAIARLEEELGPLADEPVSVAVGEDGFSAVEPGSTGLVFDAEATTRGLTGFTFDPRVLWGRVFGMGAVEPVTDYDEGALREAVERVAEELDVPPVEGAIAFAGGEVEVTEPANGIAVDVEAAVETVARGWLTEEHPLELPTDSVPPTIGEEAVRAAREELADPLVSGPVTVLVTDEDLRAELSPEALAEHATILPEGSELVLELDGQGLADAAADANAEIEVGGEDARIVLGDGGPEVVPSTTGRGLDPELLAEAVEGAGTSGEDRTAEMELVDVEPEFTTADAEEAIGDPEELVYFTTPHPHDPPRTQNLVRGTELVNGTLVMPGEEFSLTEALAPITTANGFVPSGVVQEGFSSEAVGGGLSQVSTNMYNIGFRGGMEILEYQPHSRWFDRYPAGIESTLWEGSIDMRWRNNTDYAVMVQAWVADGKVHSRLWGTDVWEVDFSASDHYAHTSPQTRYNTADQCISESGGQNGFSVDVSRTVRDRESGEVVDELSYTWTYQPWHRVVCGPPPSQQGGDD